MMESRLNIARNDSVFPWQIGFVSIARITERLRTRWSENHELVGECEGPPGIRKFYDDRMRIVRLFGAGQPAS